MILIDMEMPTSCYWCPFMNGSWGYSPPHKARCIIAEKDMPVDERHVQHNLEHCPLQELPPHGRLIDADDLRTIISDYTQVDALGHTPLQLCDAMPTVIPATQSNTFNALEALEEEEA